MRINRIEVYNVGSYEGYNEFDVEKQGLSGNIIVVGGKNGAGKTTLFTAIKLCLYGFKEAGYQTLNSFYKKEIKKLVNDKAKAENDSKAFVLLNLEIMNGQDWDQYILKREWDLGGSVFETFSVSKNNAVLDDEEKIDFENYLMNLLPPELFELYFFDGEQIADFFLEDKNNERIKNAFLTICGYDTFDIIYKNFKRISKQQLEEGDPTKIYIDTEDALYLAEKQIEKCESDIQSVSQQIDLEDAHLQAIEGEYRAEGGVLTEEWNEKLLALKNEERLREEKNAWVKGAVNDLIPYIILHKEIQALLYRMNDERESERLQLANEAVVSLLPKVLESVSRKNPTLNAEISKEIIGELTKITKKGYTASILKLSKNEYERMLSLITPLLAIDKELIAKARKDIKASKKRSEKIRLDIDKSKLDGVNIYLQDKENAINKKHNLINKRDELQQKNIIYQQDLENAKTAYSKAAKDLEKHFKTQSVTALTAKSILFLENLQKKLYDAEILKVKKLFMMKMQQLMRKEQFIDRIEVDDEFNVHVYKRVELEISGIKNKIRTAGTDEYLLEYGKNHCNDLLENTDCESLDEFVKKSFKVNEMINVLMEFDKSTMSKGEKQVFIMALYWSIMQLCNKGIPFIIDTPFARIDTEHREHITEHFFKELNGQVFIFSTDEEITSRHMRVIGDDLGGKFLIENENNTKTSIIAGKYFGD